MADKDDDKTVEIKAEEIGKKVDASQDEIPDYDITEISDVDADKTGIKKEVKSDDDHEDDDRRLSKREQATDEGREHRKLTNREKRQLKKKRVAEKFDAKDALIRQQQEQLNQMSHRLNEVDGRLSTYDETQFVQTWNGAVEAFNAAEKKHADAFSAGDGAGATAAMREMYLAQRTIDQLEEFKQRKGNMPRQPAAQAPKHDPRIMAKAQAWAAKNDWFKAGSGDEDSTLADALAAKLRKEGYDPTTDDYWDELDERLEKRGIGNRSEGEDDEDEDYIDTREVEKKPARRRSPPVGGGAGGGRSDLGNGKVAVSLPTAFVQTLKDNGYWEDSHTRNKMIKSYLRGVKERGEA